MLLAPCGCYEATLTDTLAKPKSAAALQRAYLLTDRGLLIRWFAASVKLPRSTTSLSERTVMHDK
jgi:hypothetical protein